MNRTVFRVLAIAAARFPVSEPVQRMVFSVLAVALAADLGILVH